MRDRRRSAATSPPSSSVACCSTVRSAGGGPIRWPRSACCPSSRERASKESGAALPATAADGWAGERGAGRPRPRARARGKARGDPARGPRALHVRLHGGRHRPAEPAAAGCAVPREAVLRGSAAAGSAASARLTAVVLSRSRPALTARGLLLPAGDDLAQLGQLRRRQVWELAGDAALVLGQVREQVL